MVKFARAVATALALSAVLAACSSGGNSAATASSSAPTVASDTTASNASTAGETLTLFALRGADLPAGVTMKLVPGGDQVAGQVTLDMCGADFPSEGKRVARLQQIARDAANKTVVNDENVQYASASDAAQALVEVRAAVNGCDPTQFVASHVAGIPKLRYQLELIPDSQLGALADDHVAIAATLTSQQGQMKSQVAIYQRRGAILAGIYGPTLNGVLAYAQLIATRMANLTPQQAGE